MGNHVLRPLYVLVTLTALVLIVRSQVVPEDFGVGASGYMYGWHRKANEDEWKSIPPKYRGAAYCKDCHAEKHETARRSAHARISCENCHGPAKNHPEDPPKLLINRAREHCLRCHAALPYADSARALIKSVDPKQHNPGASCADCHDPHQPRLGGEQ